MQPRLSGMAELAEALLMLAGRELQEHREHRVKAPSLRLLRWRPDRLRRPGAVWLLLPWVLPQPPRRLPLLPLDRHPSAPIALRLRRSAAAAARARRCHKRRQHPPAPKPHPGLRKHRAL